MSKPNNMFYLLEQRGYKYVTGNVSKYIFVKDRIICEVFPDDVFNLVYTNENITGYLTTGKIQGLCEDKLFNKVESEFIKTIELLEENNNG